VEGAPGRVRAKTGLLNRVTSLSGFAELPAGDVAIFSVLTNGYRGSDEAAMDALDRFVAVLTSP
jgi:D-alanyl-D-alanine carboxypeptidase